MSSRAARRKIDDVQRVLANDEKVVNTAAMSDARLY